MPIDWFTVVSQLFNFAILAWLLKRYLYKPILAALDSREERIAAELADAQRIQLEATTAREEFQQKNQHLEQQRAILLRKVADEADSERQRLLDEARTAAALLRSEWQAGLQRSQLSLNDELARRTREEVFAIARKALADLAGASLEEQMGAVFLDRLRTLEPSARQSLTTSRTGGTGAVLVHSAFELSPPQRDAIQQAVDALFATQTEVRFTTTPDVVCGIELIANGRKVAWTIAGYLDSLQRRVAEVLVEPDRPGAPAPPATTAAAGTTESG